MSLFQIWLTFALGPSTPNFSFWCQEPSIYESADFTSKCFDNVGTSKMKKGVTSQVLWRPPASCRNFYAACATCYGLAGHVDHVIRMRRMRRSKTFFFRLRKCPGRCPKSRIHRDHDYFDNQVGRGISCSIVPCAIMCDDGTGEERRWQG